jgi:hypothetical protein
MRALLGPSLGFVLFAAFLGCGLDEQLSPLPGDGSGGAGGSGGFASTSAASGGGGEEEPPVPPSEPVSLAVPEWRVAKVKDAAEDPVRAAIEAGTFDLPPEG